MRFICSVERPSTKFAAREWQTMHSARLRKVPRLLPVATGCCGVANAELAFFAFLRNEPRVGLIIVPFVGVAEPLAPLAGHQRVSRSCLRLAGLSVFHFE